MTVRFENDDAAYLQWLRHNPSGYVLNVRANPDPGYVVLHRATCGSISSDRRAATAYTGAGYPSHARQVFDPVVEAIEDSFRPGR